jgi:hypothetical protein
VEKFLDGLEPPALFLVGPVEALELAVRLRPTEVTERMLDVVLVMVALEGVIAVRAVVLVGVD